MSYYEQKFREVLEEIISIEEFENWIYNTPQLEIEFKENDYFELISFNYKKAKHNDIRKLLSKYINLGEIEKNKILKTLNDLLFEQSKVLQIEKEIKFLSRTLGYTFLDEVVFPYIHYSKVYEEYNNHQMKCYIGLTKSQQKVIIDYNLLLFSISIKKLIQDIKESKIEIIHEKGKKFTFIDNRNYSDNLVIGYLPLEEFTEKWESYSNS